MRVSAATERDFSFAFTVPGGGGPGGTETCSAPNTADVF